MAEKSYDEVVKLAEQLTPEEKKALINHLRQTAKQRQLTPEERIALIEAAIMSTPVNQEPPIRREDWYDDDGR